MLPTLAPTSPDSPTETAAAPVEVIAFPNGERHHVLVADERRLVIEFWTNPTDAPHALHVHDRSDEELEVLSGRVRFTLDGVVHHLVAGDRIRIPRSVDHQWHAIGDRPLHARVTFTPGCEFHAFLRDYAALAAAGRLGAGGSPGVRDRALLQRRHIADMRVTEHPRPVLRAFVTIGVGLARLTGRRLPVPELTAVRAG